MFRPSKLPPANRGAHVSIKSVSFVMVTLLAITAVAAGDSYFPDSTVLVLLALWTAANAVLALLILRLTAGAISAPDQQRSADPPYLSFPPI